MILGAFVQATNRSVVVSLTVDFKKGAGEKVGGKFFNRKANGVSGARESPVSKRSVVVFAMPRREEFCRDAVIEFAHDRAARSRYSCAPARFLLYVRITAAKPKQAAAANVKLNRVIHTSRSSAHRRERDRSLSHRRLDCCASRPAMV